MKEIYKDIYEINDYSELSELTHKLNGTNTIIWLATLSNYKKWDHKIRQYFGIVSVSELDKSKEISDLLEKHKKLLFKT